MKTINHYTIVVAYDGTEYHGWQEQDGPPTIAGTLQEAFYRVFNHTISVVGASRTDQGVHALGQVARFCTPFELDEPTMLRAWNGKLPRDIHIRSLKKSAPGFHPQHNVIEKEYHYYLFLKRPLPMFARFGYFHPYPLDLEKLTECLSLFEGTHDFWSFSAENNEQHHQASHTICTVSEIGCAKLYHGTALRITVRGKRFLYHMVRRIVGSSVAIAASQKRSPDEIANALATSQRRDRFQTAPARGLVLRKIKYKYPS